MRIGSSETVALLALLAVQVLLVALALTGLAWGAEGRSATLTVLLEQPPAVSDRQEPAQARRRRLEEVARAIDTATPHLRERALLLAVGWHESRWASSVCSGDRLGDEGRAHGCWQSWDPDRSDGVRGQARRAVEHLRRAAGYCRARGTPWALGAVSLYATGRHCRWSGAEARVATWRQHLRRMGR